MSKRYVIIRFLHINLGLKWCQNGAQQVGKVAEQKVYQVLPYTPPNLAVLIELWDAEKTAKYIENAVYGSSLLEVENGYLDISQIMDESDAKRFMGDFRDIDDDFEC